MLSGGAEVDTRDAEGMTPLMRAAAREEVYLVQTFLNHGADIHAKNNKGFNASHLAFLKVIDIIMHTYTPTYTNDKGFNASHVPFLHSIAITIHADCPLVFTLMAGHRTKP